MNNLETGKAGELRVLSELIIRGFRPAVPIIDDGLDIILEDGTGIQVKTALKKTTPKGHFYYAFNLQRGEPKRVDLNKVSFVICWMVEDDSFLIIPSAEAERNQIFFIPIESRINNTKNKFDVYLGNWSVIEREVIQE